MPLTTDSDCLGDLHDMLKLAAGTPLPDWWSSIVARSRAWAESCVARELSARGFTAAQVAAWDEGPTLARDLCLWRALLEGGATEQVGGEAWKLLDRREELKSDSLLVGGVWQAPLSSVGQAQSGPVSTAGDVFVWPGPDADRDPPGPGLGRPMEL